MAYDGLTFDPVEADLDRHMSDLARGEAAYDKFCEDNPLSEFTEQAAKNVLQDDDYSVRLIEDHSQAVMNLLMRTCHHGDGLPTNYDTDQRVRDEAAINKWLAGEIEAEELRLQEKAWQER